MENLTRNQVEEALNALRDIAPEEAPSIDLFAEEIIFNIVNDTEPATNSILTTVQYASVITLEELMAENAGLTRCQEAVGTLVVDVIFLGVGLLGLRIGNTDKAGKFIIKGIKPKHIEGLKGTINYIQYTTSFMDVGRGIASMFGEIYDMGCMGMLFQYLKGEMKWWQWIKTAVSLVVQLVSWFLTGGAAFVAEIILNVTMVAQIIEDTVYVAKDCGGSNEILPCTLIDLTAAQ